MFSYAAHRLSETQQSQFNERRAIRKRSQNGQSSTVPPDSFQIETACLIETEVR